MILRKRAWDIMRTDFAKVDDQATLADVMKIMRESLKDTPEAHIVLVLSEMGNLRGVVSAFDVLKTAENIVVQDQSVLSDSEGTDWDAAFRRACGMCSGIEITKVMNDKVPSVKPNDPLLLVLHALVEARHNWIVVEEGEKPIGIIVISDLYREITREMVAEM
ncbi:MAG: HPP family protein [Desulfovibrio sp.]|uniref:CBS domain-containing protein n=1 Tax=Desulfovibrio sp. 7SRBS1 TaxID=3378064 RepID=UPI003B4130F0